jgi:hypothetical protein
MLNRFSWYLPIFLLSLLACHGGGDGNGNGNGSDVDPATAPVISNVLAGSTTSSSALITWSTNVPADSQVEYGLTASYGSLSAVDSHLVTSHAVSLSPLSPASGYHFRVKSKDASGTLVVSQDGTFTTNSASEIIPADRKIDWSQSGVPGGIPNRTTVHATIPVGASRLEIQSALDVCPTDQVVQLSAGSYTIDGSLTIPSGVTLRGAGPQQTILNGTGSGVGLIQFGPEATPMIANSVAITAGATAGSTSLTLDAGAPITAGSYLLITELNDASFVTITTSNGTCTWCDGGVGWNGTRVRGQIVEVVSVADRTIAIKPGLYTGYPSSPLATPFAAGAVRTGVEDLQVYLNNTGYVTNFYMNACAYCWIKNVESNYTDGDHARVFWGYRNEIRDSYFHDAFNHSPGNTDTDIFLADKTTGTLVENNVLRRLHVSIMFNWGAAGNVVAYNYADNNFDTNGYNTVFPGFSFHGAHPQFNLLEGNLAPQFNADYFWGSSSHQTVFRNWLTGSEFVIPPLTGRSPEDPASGFWAFYGLSAVDLSQTVRDTNLIGNIIGSDWQKTLSQWTPQVIYPGPRSYYTNNNPYGYSFGFANPSDTGGDAGNNDLPFTTAIIHGDYDYVAGQFHWDPGITNQSLPPSLYLSSKPAWFGSLTWPPFGPDPNDPSTPLTGTIPAKYCYDHGQMPNAMAGIVVTPATP